MAVSVRQFRFLARGSASTSAHQSSPVAVSSSTKFGMRQRSAAHTLGAMSGGQMFDLHVGEPTG